VAALVFVDSVLPSASGSLRLAPAGRMSQLRALASDGVLPPWSSWFGQEAMRELIPEERLRATLEEEMPRLPLSYFEASVPLPGDWSARPCAYLAVGVVAVVSAPSPRTPATDDLRARRPGARRRLQPLTKAGAKPGVGRTCPARPKRASGGRRRRRPQSRAQAEALVTQAAAPYAAGGSAWPSLVVEPHDVAERDFDAPVAGNGPSGPSLVPTQTP
jgi:hypothetical protein